MFTHNEAIRGLPSHSAAVQKFLIESAKTGKWLAGVHIQGFCCWIGKWKRKPWESFFMWTEDEEFLSEIPKEILLPMNCINWMPEVEPGAVPRDVDICFIGHATWVKRINESMALLRRLMDLKPDLKAIIIVPDHRDIRLGDDTYKKEGFERSFYDDQMKNFSSEELKNLTFICSNTHSFGTFPLAADLVMDFMRRSKFLLSYSHTEGTPRTFAEAFFCGTPCAINERAYFGMRRAHNDKNTLWLSDDIETAAHQLFDGLNNYQRFSIDREQVLDAFSEKRNIGKLRSFLEEQIERHGFSVNGEWYLKDLNLRLPCHGQKINHQFFNNENLFFEWIEKVSKYGPYDEDRVLGLPPLNDAVTFYRRVQNLKAQVRGFLGKLKRKLAGGGRAARAV